MNFSSSGSISENFLNAASNAFLPNVFKEENISLARLPRLSRPEPIESAILEKNPLLSSFGILSFLFLDVGLGAETVALSPVSAPVSSNIPNHSRGFLKKAGNLCNLPFIQFFNLSFQLPSGDNDFSSSVSPPSNQPANILKPLTKGPPPTKARTPSPKSLNPSPIFPLVNASHAIPNLFMPPTIGKFIALSDMYVPI